MKVVSKKGFSLDENKAIHSLLYVCESQGGACDMYTLLKIIFFADSMHLFTYGRPITGDKIMAMDYGPVPSFCYNEVKKSQCDDRFFENGAQDIIRAKTKPNLKLFSESDIECLNTSIRENAALGFKKLKEKSHTAAYLKIDKDREPKTSKPMPFIDIAREDGHVSDDMIKYIASRFEY